MEEDKPKITKVVKEKDPNKVAAGKKLAEYQKTLRERKKQRAEEAQVDADVQDDPQDKSSSTSSSLTHVLGFAGLCATLVGVYFTYVQAQETQELVNLEEKHHPQQNHPQLPKSNLKSFD